MTGEAVAHNSHIALGAGAEFDTIRALLEEWGAWAEGIGDDAAVLALPPGMQVVVSTDATVEDVHFRRKWISAHDVGARAATAAFSDLAAMGATPKALLVSLVVPTIWREHLRDFAAGLKTTVASVKARIIGGNISRGAAFSCTLTVIGYTAAPVSRNGAQPGDRLYVTGRLGGPAAAVAAWEQGGKPLPWALDRFLQPVARVEEGLWLARNGAHALIDISDGLLADSRHIAAASHVRCVINAESVPRFDDVAAEQAMVGGEEYELLVALPANEAPAIEVAFRNRFNVPLTQVGVVKPLIESRTGGALPVESAIVELPAGHDHFSTG